MKKDNLPPELEYHRIEMRVFKLGEYRGILNFLDIDMKIVYWISVPLNPVSPNDCTIYNYTTQDGKALSPETIQHVKQFAYDLVRFEQGKSSHNPLKEYKDEGL